LLGARVVVKDNIYHPMPLAAAPARSLILPWMISIPNGAHEKFVCYEPREHVYEHAKAICLLFSQLHVASVCPIQIVGFLFTVSRHEPGTCDPRTLTQSHMRVCVASRCTHSFVIDPAGTSGGGTRPGRKNHAALLLPPLLRSTACSLPNCSRLCGMRSRCYACSCMVFLYNALMRC